jgi:hypothetical protein
MNKVEKRKITPSFDLPGVLCRLGSRLFHLCLLDDIFHYTYAAFRIRRNLDSTLVFASYWDFVRCHLALIRVCNMGV